VQKLHFSYNVTIDDRDFLVKQKPNESSPERESEPILIFYGFQFVKQSKQRRARAGIVAVCSGGIVIEAGFGHGKERRVLVLLNEFLERLFRLVRLFGKAVNSCQLEGALLFEGLL
jgi:hypothetical protein